MVIWQTKFGNGINMSIEQLFAQDVKNTLLIILLIFTVVPTLFEILMSAIVGKHKKAITQPVFWIPKIIGILIIVVLFLLLYNFPEIFQSILGVK